MIKNKYKSYTIKIYTVVYRAPIHSNGSNHALNENICRCHRREDLLRPLIGGVTIYDTCMTKEPTSHL